MSTRVLLATTTGEPYQPVRLTFALADGAEVRRRLRRLKCVTEGELAGSLQLWLDEEARSMALGKPAASVEAGGRRVILGLLTFPDPASMALEVRSIQRAVEVARFLRGQLGSTAAPVRARVVNRLFEAETEKPDLAALDRALDEDVTVVDPAVVERELEAVLEGAKTVEEKQAAYLRFQEERRKRDVPAVEDFPLWPEEETENLDDLHTTLQLRFMRAVRHWQGEPITLANLIHEVVGAQQKAASRAKPASRKKRR